MFTPGWLSRIHRMARPIDGELTRYRPLILTGNQSDEEHRWVVLDLDEHRIAREAIPRSDYSHFEQVRVNDHHYFWHFSWDYGGLLIAIDGTTGDISGAVHDVDDFSPAHFVGDRIWLHTRDWRAASDAPVAVYDAATLTPIGAISNDVSFQPFLEESRELLGFHEVAEQP